jgi:lysozyme family protein
MSDQAFRFAMNFILPHEDEYARGHWGDPNFVVAEDVSGDSGGVTKYGIDAASHPGIDVANLTQAGAISIYHEEWMIDGVDRLPDKLAVCAFDVFVNGGHGILWIQHGYNVVMPAGYHLTEDGVLGPATVEALNALTPAQIDAICQVFIAERNARFAAIATGPRAQFLVGWEQRDSDLAAYLASVT